MGLFLGIDTSCYTTSVACVDEKGIVYEKRTVLSVKLGQRGLRQSEGLFQHVRNLESLLPGMLACLDRSQIRGIGVSRPSQAGSGFLYAGIFGRPHGRCFLGRRIGSDALPYLPSARACAGGDAGE